MVWRPQKCEWSHSAEYRARTRQVRKTSARSPASQSPHEVRSADDSLPVAQAVHSLKPIAWLIFPVGLGGGFAIGAGERSSTGSGMVTRDRPTKASTPWARAASWYP